VILVLKCFNFHIRNHMELRFYYLNPNNKMIYFDLLPYELLEVLLSWFSPVELLQSRESLESYYRFAGILTSEEFWIRRWKTDISSIIDPVLPNVQYRDVIQTISSIKNIDSRLIYSAVHGYDITLQQTLKSFDENKLAILGAAKVLANNKGHIKIADLITAYSEPLRTKYNILHVKN